MLTKKILQDAADLLWDGEDSTGTSYMCHAVQDAAREEAQAPDGPVRRAFEGVLKAHGITTAGDLSNDFFDADGMDYPERQALRFDFLNLLAESL